MKKWLSNLRIKYKLYLITIIGVISIFLMGLAALYFFNTSKVITFIFNGERLHTVYFQLGVEHFYNHIQTGKQEHLDECYAYLDKANKMAFVFGSSEEYANTLSNEEFIDKLHEVLDEAVDNKRSNTGLLADRLKLLLWLDNSSIKTTLDVAVKGANLGKNVKKNITIYIENPSDDFFNDLTASIDEMHLYYGEFAASLNDINDYANRLLLLGILGISLLLAIVTLLISFFISRMISYPIFSLVSAVDKISTGDLSSKLVIKSKDEIGNLAAKFSKMQSSLLEVVQRTKQIANGDYETRLEPKSEKDDLSISVNQMTEALQRSSIDNDRKNWFSSGLNELNEAMRGDFSINDLSKKIITYLSKFIDAQVGTFYTYNKIGDFYELNGSYAFTKRKSISNKFKAGEGLTGQAAIEKDIISITDIPEDYFRITSATGNALPRNILICPFIYQGVVISIAEFGKTKEFSDDIIEFIRMVNETIAINLNSAVSRQQLEELLEKTQQQATELQQQQEELRVANEELEEQTEALKKSEKELQQQQEELRVTNEELEEKTHSLEEQRKQITQNNKELEKTKTDLETKARELEITSKYKSEFLANMSHELRTPLNSLLILSGSLAENKEGNLSSDQIESSKIINKSGNDLLTLINEILDLSKIESGKMDINIQDAYISNVIDNIKRNFKHVAEEKDLGLNVTSEEDVPASFQTDQFRFEQVIRNLISNALKFTRQGSIDIRFYIPPKSQEYRRPEMATKNVIGIAVKDSGIGIPKEKQLEIFEAFQQADGSISREFGGTGLGLSISRELIKLLGGEIHLSSEVGQGSVFTIFLPVQYVMHEAAGNATVVENKPVSSLVTKAEVPAIAKPDTKSGSDNEIIESDFVKDDRTRISPDDKVMLIIEDDKNFAKVVYKMTREKGFKGLVSPTGEEGLKLAEEFIPDAIILDLKLPGIDGYKVLEAIKDNPETRHIPVHIMSGVEENIEVYQKGAIGYLTKPATKDMMDDAFMKLESYLDRKVKDLLIVEDDKDNRLLMRKLIGGTDVNLHEVESGEEAIALLQKQSFDCMVLDLGLPDIPGLELLNKLKDEIRIEIPPVIVYTGKELTIEENNELQKHTSSIIIKGVKSDERLLDETALFLHRVVDELPEKKQQMISQLHDKDAIFQGKKILVVDDDMRNVFAITKVLEERDFIVVEAENGKAALEKLDDEKDIDLVLMDIMMPEMDGYECMREIRKISQFKDLPIIALTAKAMKDDFKKAISAGANDYMSKPVNIEKLLSLLRVWLYK